MQLGKKQLEYVTIACAVLHGAVPLVLSSSPPLAPGSPSAGKQPFDLCMVDT